MNENQDIFDFIVAAPTAAHAVEECVRRLDSAGYIALREENAWELKAGGKYYVRRSQGALIAFRMTEDMPTGAMMVAAHTDSPTFSITPSCTSTDGMYTRLTVEKYGGMLCASWMDRPLSIAGTVVVRKSDGALETRTVRFDRDMVIIPSVAIHMNRQANEQATYNPAVDMQPLWGDKDGVSIRALVAEELGVSENDILSEDLSLYNRQAPVTFGGHGEFIGAARLDDLACAYAALQSFLFARDGNAIPMCVLFDNEEVGSSTYSGAGSDFLAATLQRLTASLALDEEAKARFLAQSFLVSADNAHAVHPNHPEYANKENSPLMNGGVVIKYNANCRYLTDAQSSAVFGEICRRAEVPTQIYCNRADKIGGSTLGCISVTQLSVPTVDIGLAQLSMHSAYESMGSRDVAFLVKALAEFYGTTLTHDKDGNMVLISATK